MQALLFILNVLSSLVFGVVGAPGLCSITIELLATRASGLRSLMAQAEAEPFSFVLPTSAVPPVVGYQLHGQPHGACLHWEWRYFHYQLHSRDLKDWLKDSGHRILQRVAADFSLPGSAIDCGRSSAVCPRLTCTTRAVGFLLLHAARVKCLKADVKAMAWGLCKSWFALALKGLPMLGSGQLDIPVMHGQKLHTVRVDSLTGVVSGHEEFLAQHDQKLKQQWKAKGAQAGGWQRQLAHPIVTDLLMFLVALDASIASALGWLNTLVAQLSQVVAQAIEKYMVFSYFPAHGKSKQIPVLRGKHTARDIDPITRQHVQEKMRELSGSQVHTAKAVLGTGWHASAHRHATVLLYDEACRETFAGAKQISLACDPGSYSGEATNVGIIYSPTMDKTAVLPAKAMPTCQSHCPLV